jgi:hypothetical protein
MIFPFRLSRGLAGHRSHVSRALAVFNTNIPLIRKLASRRSQSENYSSRASVSAFNASLAEKRRLVGSARGLTFPPQMPQNSKRGKSARKFAQTARGIPERTRYIATTYPATARVRIGNSAPDSFPALARTTTQPLPSAVTVARHS